MLKIQVDPRTRLMLAVSLTTLGVIENRIIGQSLLLAASIVLCLIFGKIGISIILKAKWLLGFFVLMAVLQSLFNADERVVFAFRNINIITLGGLEQAACFLCRMTVIILAAGILAAAGSRNMIQGLIALKLPYELAFMTTCTLSFLPLIASDMKDSLTAFQLRGVDIDKLPFTRKLKVYGYLIIPVLEGIVIKAKELSCAMEMRAFRAYNIRTSYAVLFLKPKDYVIMALTLTAFVTCLFI